MGGVFPGVVVFLIALAGVYVGRIAGEKAINLLDFRNRKEKVDHKSLKRNFALGFEGEKEMKVFEARQAALRQSTQHVTQGNHSLWVEIPAGREYPGIATEVYGRDCFDWSDMEEFSFEVYNEISIPARLTIKIKSGRGEPKKQYETTLTLPVQETGRVKIFRKELEGALDLDRISGISVFMQDPPTTFYLYFDNLKVSQRQSQSAREEPEITEARVK